MMQIEEEELGFVPDKEEEVNELGNKSKTLEVKALFDDSIS